MKKELLVMKKELLVMKKVLCGWLALALVLLSACGGGDETPAEETNGGIVSPGTVSTEQDTAEDLTEDVPAQIDEPADSAEEEVQEIVVIEGEEEAPAEENAAPQAPEPAVSYWVVPADIPAQETEITTPQVPLPAENPKIGEDLAPLTRERAALVQEDYAAWYAQYYVDYYQQVYHRALSPQEQHNLQEDLSNVQVHFYYGTYDGHEVVLMSPYTFLDSPASMMTVQQTIAGQQFVFPTLYHLWVHNGAEFVELSVAYADALLTEEEVEILHWVHENHKYHTYMW